MRKSIAALLISICTISLIGCNNEISEKDSVIVDENTENDGEIPENKYEFRATVIEVTEKGCVVTPFEYSTEFKSADKIYLDTKEVIVRPGDIIEIVYDGMIAETYPAQINNVEYIEVVEKAAEEDQDANVEAYRDLGIELSILDFNASGVELACKQSGGEPKGNLQTDSYFILEKLSETGDWVELPYVIENPAWTAEAYIISMNETTSWKINWSWLYGDIGEGKYRIGKDIMDFETTEEYITQMYYAEFEIY